MPNIARCDLKHRYILASLYHKLFGAIFTCKII